ncbi:uncharacterized protein LOC124148116 [Haliotis rufescens]|uniref:uncharacterized protein LOC124148116 n=1 Tax=Haliotis rufescens TaxID=6454 RepID=UPI00201F3907|nr:uncharacterized protein LOC124148116 [Haliotis rufescens]
MALKVVLLTCAIFGVIIPGRDGACSFPSHLSGTFDESVKGVLSFTSSQLMSYVLHTFGTLNFNCDHQYSSTQYVLKSATSFSYFSLNWDAYMCWDLTEISTDKFYFYESTDALSDAGGENVKMYISGASPVYSDVCSTSSYTAGTYRFLMRNDTISSSKVACPYQFENYWTYSISNGSVDTCSSNETQLNGCLDTTAFTFNYTLCSSYLLYSSGGSVNCLYNYTSGSTTYLTTYNADYSVDDTSTYRFTCLVLDLSSSTSISASQYPRSCQVNQSATSVPSPGNSLVFTFNASCYVPTTTTITTTTTTTTTTASVAAAAASLDWVAAVVIAILVVLGLFIAAYVYCCYNYRKEMDAHQRKIIDCRAADDEHRATDEKYEERGQAPPSVKFTFPDYTRRVLSNFRKKQKGDRTRLVKDDDDRPLSPSGISVRETESPDSALGMDEDDGYPMLRSQRSRPVSDFMKRLITLHDEQREKEKERAKIPEEKRFMKIHGRKGFQDEKSLTSSAGVNLVSKIKKMARKRRKTSAAIQSSATDARKANEVHENEANELVERDDEAGSQSSDDVVPIQLDVSQLLAYTALPPFATETPRGDDRRPKAVTIADGGKIINDVIVEDLDNTPAMGSPERAEDASKVYTVSGREVTPNMKFRREPVSTKVRQNNSYLGRIHRKPPASLAMPDIETARVTSGGLRRSAADADWGKYLDEIYPDKLYMDYAKATSTRSESMLRHKADDGLDYLYDRALYWKKSEPVVRPSSRAKSTRSIRKKGRSANSATVSRSRSLHSPALYRDTTL